MGRHRNSPIDSDDVIGEMEEALCRKYRLARPALYSTLQHGDFHRTWQDPSRFWTIACYASFSGEVLTHRLGYEPLKSLLADFDQWLATHRAAWDAVVCEKFVVLPRNDDDDDSHDDGDDDHQIRNYVAIAHRYACAVADDYVWPPADPYLAGKLTPAQLVELNAYLEFVSTERKIPAGKPTRQACQRQLDDLAKSGGIVLSSAPQRDFAAKAINRRENEHNN